MNNLSTLGEGEKRRIAILGGAFNPPTNQHIQLATEIVHSGQVDAVWLTPCGPRPDKPDMGTTPQQRLIMCEIAVNTTVSATFPIAVTDHEVGAAMATYDSLCYLRDRYPDCIFSFVIGSDWLQPGTDLRKWESKDGMTGDKLISEFDFLVMRRPGYDVDDDDLSQFGPRFCWMDLPHGFKLVESTASSTEVRKRAKQAWSAEGTAVTTLASLDGLGTPRPHRARSRRHAHVPSARESPPMMVRHRRRHFDARSSCSCVHSRAVAPGVHAYILRHRLYRKVNWKMVRERADSLRPLIAASRDRASSRGETERV